MIRIACVLSLLMVVPLSAAPPTDRELIDAVQRQVKAVVAKTDAAIACVVVSRSTLYPNPPAADSPGKLGDFDPLKFLQTSTLRDKREVARRLDLADRNSIPDNSYGGGVVIDASGLVLTPYHVIDGATKIYVRLAGGKGSYANIHAADARSDLAVLKLLSPPPNLKSVPLAEVRTTGANANVDRGTFAVLMSNTPDSAFVDQAAGSMSLITGVRERPRDRLDERSEQRMWSIYTYGLLLQYANQFPAGRQSKLNLGCSGACLFNLDGELVGLTTTASPLAAGDDSAGYALPMDAHARRAIGVLKRGEEVEYGFLGVSTTLTSEGLTVNDRPSAGPAGLAGVRIGDTIREVDGEPIEVHKDLFFHVGSSLVGGKVSLRVKSPAGALVDRVVTLGKYQHSLPFIASARPGPVFGLRVEHASILYQQLGPDFTTAVPAGVVVRELVPGSPAEEKFKALTDGGGRWVITHVNGTAIATPTQFATAAQGKDHVTLSLIELLDSTQVGSPRSRELSLP